jgi:leader peptidase (prepilin peptidase) / N-methyltransferase
LPENLIATYFFIFGAIFGSFANVLVVRLPESESIIPGSHCRSCKVKVLWYDNIPLFSYLWLRGKCRHCGQKFSSRYFMVELTMAVLFAAAYLKFGLQWYLLEVLIFIFGAVTASYIDIKHYILPDIFTLGGLVLALIGAFLNPNRSFVDAVIGFLLGGGIFYLTAYLYFLVRKREGMGGGDIKLLAWIGALMGWQSIPFVIVFSGFSGGLFGVLRSAVQKGDLGSPVPFGPFLVAGALVYLLGGHTIVQWYLQNIVLG